MNATAPSLVPSPWRTISTLSSGFVRRSAGLPWPALKPAPHVSPCVGRLVYFGDDMNDTISVLQVIQPRQTHKARSPFFLGLSVGPNTLVFELTTEGTKKSQKPAVAAIRRLLRDPSDRMVAAVGTILSELRGAVRHDGD